MNTVFRAMVVIAGLTAAVGCSRTAATPGAADTLYYGGDIVTMDGDAAIDMMIEAVKNAGITAHHLEFLDGEGNLVARFEAAELQ